MSGIFGLALREGRPGHSAVESAQATVAGLLAAARGQAASEPKPRACWSLRQILRTDHFLRGIHVAVESAPKFRSLVDCGRRTPSWRSGVYLVPGAARRWTAQLFAAGRCTRPLNVAGWTPLLARMAGRKYDFTGRQIIRLGQISGHERATDGASLSAADAGRETNSWWPSRWGDAFPAGVIFEHPDQVRGIALSAYGVAILLNDAAGLRLLVPSRACGRVGVHAWSRY